MPDLKQFNLPDIGEGLTEADILKWAVQPGDTVAVNQILVEIETAKAAVELPSPFAGVVSALHAAVGDTVDVGRAIITIDIDPHGAAEVSGPADLAPPTPIAQGRQAMLVGYGPKADGVARRRARIVVGAEGSAPIAPRAEPPIAPRAEPPTKPTEAPTARRRAAAKPPVRRLAKSLGVDLDSVAPTGPNGTVSRSDVELAANAASDPSGGAHGTGFAAAASGTGADFPRETRVPVKGVRKHTAAAMVGSAFSAPHVTEFITVDVTAMMELRDRIAARREFAGLKVSPLLLLAKAVIMAVERTPEINASWDGPAGEIVLKHYVNLGIAAATERGLIVPNIRDADQLGLLGLAQAMGVLTDRARSGRTAPVDMLGGTITITNIGVFGIDTGTPIINPGESAIVAFGAVRRLPWVVEEQIVPRWVTTLAVSFDHRVVDGQQGSQFLADVAGVVSDPGLALL